MADVHVLIVSCDKEGGGVAVITKCSQEQLLVKVHTNHVLLSTALSSKLSIVMFKSIFSWVGFVY